MYDIYIISPFSAIQVIIRGGGHILPYDQPERSFVMIDRFLSTDGFSSPWSTKIRLKVTTEWICVNISMQSLCFIMKRFRDLFLIACCMLNLQRLFLLYLFLIKGWFDSMYCFSLVIFYCLTSIWCSSIRWCDLFLWVGYVCTASSMSFFFIKLW